MQAPQLPLTKQQKQWNKQLNQHLDRYSYLRDWSQLASWLSKLKNLLIDYKSAIVDKQNLFKRLATSLNGSLPVALHQSTLEIYEMLFINSITIDSLQLAMMGLFSFYSIANIKNKQKIIELFSKFFPNYANDLKILTMGLLIAILPSLNEMHDPLVKEIYSLFDLLSKPQLIGAEMIHESIWVAVLRSSNCRVAGLKFISQKIGKGAMQDENDQEDNFWNQTAINKKAILEEVESQQEQVANEPSVINNNKLKENETKELIRQFCPNMETLVINAIVTCIQDTNILVVKSALDFLYKYLPLKSDFLADEAKMRLAKSVIWLLGKRDMSVTRKINLWLFGKPDEQNRYVINHKNVKFISQTLIHFFLNDNSIEPLKIIFNLYSEHEELPHLTLQYLVKDMISYCFKQEHNAEILKFMSRLVQKCKNQVSIFYESLGKQLIKSIKQNEYQQAARILHLILFLINKILKAEDSKLMLFAVIKIIMESYIITSWKDTQYMKKSLKQTLDLLEIHKEVFKSIKLSQQEESLLDSNNKLHQDLIDYVEQKEKERHFQDEVYLINRVIVKINEVFNVHNQNWILNLIKNISLVNPHHYISPIEVIGQTMDKQNLLKKEIIERSEDLTKNNSIKISIAKIWGILSLGHLQNRVLPLLFRLVKYFPHFFEILLDQQFEKYTEMTIIKFSLFWELGPKYASIISQDQLEQVSKPGLFRMLQFLDNGNPLVKYNTNIWINECFPNFHRVLNPLLEIMLKPKGCWYQTFQGQYIYAILPQNEKLMKAINHLKSVIKHTSQKFNKFSLKPLTNKILPYYYIFKGMNDMKTENQEIPYINTILELIVRFTETKYYNIDSPGIDLAACELLEVLIRNINSSQLSNYILKNNIRDILNSLHFATVNEEHLLQIQILNLLKIIFIQSNIKRYADSKILKEAISNNYFINTILEGLNSNFPYIKERFVEFINYSIHLFLEYHNNCSQIISRILNTYTTKISYINSKKNQIANLKDLQISKQNAEILILFDGIKELLSYFLNLQVKIFDKQKHQHATDSGLFSFYTWKSYVELKIDKKNIDSTKIKKLMEDISKQIINQLQYLIEIMTSCWTLSDLLSFYKLSRQGLQIFDYDSFLIYNTQLRVTQNRVQTEDSIENFIINLFRVFINTYPQQTVNALIHSWEAASKSVETKLKILEILNFSSIPLFYFYQIFTESINSDKIGKKRKINSLQFEKSIEQDILHLCQVYTHYSYQNQNFFQPQNLITIWLQFCKFIKIFQNTKNVLTLYGMLELVDLFVKKNNPKEIIRDQRLKKQLNTITTALNDLILVCSGKIKLVNHQVLSKEKEKVNIQHFLPLATSIYEQYMISFASDSLSHPSYFNLSNITSVKALEYCRIHSFIIAKRITYNLLTCLHNDSQIALVKKIREIFVFILPIVEDKEQDSLLVENASELILAMVQKKHIFLKEFKHEILQIFNKEDFFICTSKTLHSWTKIIDLIIDNNKDHDIFHEYLEKVSLVSSIFSSFSLETKKKIKSFERICFILYSGDKDKYNDKAHLLIDKIIEVIKNAEAPQPVLILIFFCIRILILRMSPQKLTKLLAGVWQMIIFLLINIFNGGMGKERLNLIWAALKLIEMISIMQIGEFHCHQWMFFYDFVGLKFNTGEGEGKQEWKVQLKPKIHRFLSSDIKLYKQEIPVNEEKRHLIIKQDKIDDIQLLKTKALLLSSYLVSNNQCKMKFDMREVEELIDNDFLNLDEFIFKFK